MNLTLDKGSKLGQEIPIRKHCSECGSKIFNTKGDFENFRWGKFGEMTSTVCRWCNRKRFY